MFTLKTDYLNHIQRFRGRYQNVQFETDLSRSEVDGIVETGVEFVPPEHHDPLDVVVGEALVLAHEAVGRWPGAPGPAGLALQPVVDQELRSRQIVSGSPRHGR